MEGTAHETGTHVLIRVRDGITLRRAGDFLPDGSYLAEISGGGIDCSPVDEVALVVAGGSGAVLAEPAEGAFRRCCAAYTPRGRKAGGQPPLLPRRRRPRIWSMGSGWSP